MVHQPLPIESLENKSIFELHGKLHDLNLLNKNHELIGRDLDLWNESVRRTEKVFYKKVTYYALIGTVGIILGLLVFHLSKKDKNG